MSKEIKLGDKVRDKVTGFEGIATAKTEFLNGCIQIEVTPKIKKGENIVDKALGIGIDEAQVERIGNGINTPEKKVVKRNTGGPMKVTPRRAY